MSVINAHVIKAEVRASNRPQRLEWFIYNQHRTKFLGGVFSNACITERCDGDTAFCLNGFDHGTPQDEAYAAIAGSDTGFAKRFLCALKWPLLFCRALDQIIHGHDVQIKVRQHAGENSRSPCAANGTKRHCRLEKPWLNARIVVSSGGLLGQTFIRAFHCVCLPGWSP